MNIVCEENCSLQVTAFSGQSQQQPWLVWSTSLHTFLCAAKYTFLQLQNTQGLFPEFPVTRTVSFCTYALASSSSESIHVTLSSHSFYLL